MSIHEDASGANRLRLIQAGVAVGVVLVLLLLWWLLRSSGSVEWAETTVPYDPTCATDCEVVGMISPGHRGAVMPLAVNPNVDDPIAQWADCIDTFTQCMEATPDPLACMAGGSCPDACRSAYAAEVSTVPGLEGQLRVFQEMFLDDEAFCRPPEEAGR